LQVFGGIERGTNNWFLVPIQDRSRETLLELVEQWILPGSLIVTDGSPAYNDIPALRQGVYMHESVNREHSRVASHDEDVHMRTLGSLWIKARKKLRSQRGTSKDHWPSAIKEFVWRMRHKDNIFCRMLLCIAAAYDLK